MDGASDGVFAGMRDWSWLVWQFLKLALAAFPRGLDRIRRSRHLVVFWKRWLSDGMIAVVPPQDVDAVLKGTQVFDFLGLKGLDDELRAISATPLKWIRSDLFLGEPSSHILVASGPIPNRIAYFLLEQSTFPRYHFDLENLDRARRNDIVSRADPGFRLSPVRSGDRILRDYGMISVLPNAYDKSGRRIAVLACGGWGWGTYTALSLLAEREALKTMTRYKDHYFQILCTCEVDEYGRAMRLFLLDEHPDPSIRRATALKLQTRVRQ